MNTMEPRTIALTGATGLIGSHLVPVLLGKGYTLRALSRASSTLMRCCSR
jgi:uncharacterized protein YbjT (DUF2867 family)